MKIVFCQNCGTEYQLEDNEDISEYCCCLCDGDLKPLEDYNLSSSRNKTSKSSHKASKYFHKTNKSSHKTSKSFRFGNLRKFRKKLFFLDYLILILVILAVIFAFIHVTSDNSSNIQKVSFDASTFNKIPDFYFLNYEEGNIMYVSINGINASNGDQVTVNGTLKWLEDNGGTNVKILVDSDETYLVGLYKNVPEADIYVNTISIESTGEKYHDLVEFKIKPMNVSSFSDFVSYIPNDTDYEFSTELTTTFIDASWIQQMLNEITGENKASSIKTSNPGTNNKIKLTRSSPEDMNIASSYLWNISCISGEITIRVYNCSDYQLNTIKNNYDVVDVRYY